MSLSRSQFPARILLFVLLCIITFTLVLDPIQYVAGSASETNIQLNSDANAIEANFPKNTQSSEAAIQAKKYAERAITTLYGVSFSISSSLMIQAAAAYKGIDVNFKHEVYATKTSAEAKTAFLSQGKYSFLVTSSGPTPTDYQTLPSITHYPLHANGVVVAYNLPTSVRQGVVLSLDGPTMCRIWRGNITRWDDPSILATNPLMNFASAAGHRITMIMQKASAGTHQAFSSYCNKIDPMWATMGIFPSSKPNYPTNLYANYMYYDDMDTVMSGMSDTLWSFALTTSNYAQKIKASMAEFTNSKGHSFACSTSFVGLTAFELGTGSYPPGTTMYDLTNPATEYGWPIATVSYIWFDKSNAVTTCATKKSLVEYFLWFYQSPVIESIAEAMGAISLPSLYVDLLQIPSRIRNDMKCQSSQLVTTNSDMTFIASSELTLNLFKLIASFYLALDDSITYSPTVITTSLATQRLGAGEISFALISTAEMVQSDIDILRSINAEVVPAFMVGVVPIFNLPTEIKTLMVDTEKVKQLELPTLLPLTLDLEVMTGIFIRSITDWLDARMLALNPQLKPWFHATNSSTNMMIVVGATLVEDSNPMSRLLFSTMAKSQLAQQAEYSYAFSKRPGAAVTSSYNAFIDTVPFNAIHNRFPDSTILIDVESRLNVKTSATPGSVSYRSLGTGTGSGAFDPSTEFQFKIKNSNGVKEIIQPSTSALRACITPYTGDATVSTLDMTADGSLNSMDADDVADRISTMRNWTTQINWVDRVTPPPSCYPVSTLISWAVPLAYASISAAGASSLPSTCPIGRHAIEFINYVQTTPTLDGPTESLGLVRVAAFSMTQRLSEQVIYSSTCDDEALLVIRPVIYTISSGAASFGESIGSVFLFIAAVSLGLIVYHRSHFVIRSSSLPFMILILLGLSLLALSSVLWSLLPSHDSCMGFQWIACLGFTLVFIPLFAKTWRIWRIFSGSQLKVVKISNLKLLMYSSIAIGIDLLILIVWSATSPMKPIEYSKMINGVLHYYTHCSVNTTSSAGILFITLEGIYKAGILVFGAVMAVSTRNVKGTFNESVQIAWAVYSALLSSVIVIAMIVFVGALGDTLTILIQIFIFWLCFTCWGLLFVPKFQLLFSDEQSIIDASKSDLPQERSNGFSFASVAAMTQIQLKQYYYALKIQIVKCETTLKISPPAKFADIKSTAAYYAPVTKGHSRGNIGTSIGDSVVGGETSRYSGRKALRDHTSEDADDPQSNHGAHSFINMHEEDNVREKYVLRQGSDYGLVNRANGQHYLVQSSVTNGGYASPRSVNVPITPSVQRQQTGLSLMHRPSLPMTTSNARIASPSVVANNMETNNNTSTTNNMNKPISPIVAPNFSSPVSSTSTTGVPVRPRLTIQPLIETCDHDSFNSPQPSARNDIGTPTLNSVPSTKNQPPAGTTPIVEPNHEAMRQ